MPTLHCRDKRMQHIFYGLCSNTGGVSLRMKVCGFAFKRRRNQSPGLHAAQKQCVSSFTRNKKAGVFGASSFFHVVARRARHNQTTSRHNSVIVQITAFTRLYLLCCECCVQGHYAGNLLRHESIIMNYSSLAVMGSNQQSETADSKRPEHPTAGRRRGECTSGHVTQEGA